ncbi:GDP GTP exchange factor for Gsp1p Gsp2p [Phialemonium atrogriseum]|uniref:GDP GTP exchange factor for Gsp1p Gsp2p n=1 Tax=Phialemonium atrogriseum TaxID=1093897 RepID=A0AAJ0BTW8_9PEZI|nr:GDP GTP exchange factor for Gsp1p Gsp2p [Phialemonium atrogriseum]KAK1764405.1 GDP GTP exchange factor for Gsp1p Gsp2p [Phialemonium atrogriseum]
MPPKKATAPASVPKRAAPKKAAPAAKARPSASSAAKKETKPVAATVKKDAKATTPAPRSKRQTAALKRKADEDSIEAAAEASQPKKAKAPAPKTKAADQAPAAKPAAKPAARKIAAPRTTKKTAAAADTAVPKQPKKTTTTGESDKENEGTESGQTKANTKRKRAPDAQAEGDEESAAEEEKPAPPAKKAKKAAAPKPVAPKRKVGKKINKAPTVPLHVFVFGEGSSGELGLGSVKVDGKKPIDVKRPRVNHNLSAKDVGVVQLACGGMHVVALTKDNKILTWGVNDQGALGRDTTWEGGLRDADADDSDDSDSEDSGLSPKESTPTEVDLTNIEPETKFVQVVASDSASFALTEDGVVYGWGTFRSSDGILGFTDKTLVQKIPVLLPDLKGITQLAAGSNHILALDNKSKVQAWGCGQQNQLGRKVFEREIKSSLRPKGIGNLPIRGAKPVRVACGSYHSFVLDQEGRVFAWGLNNYAELGIEDSAGEDDAAQLKPRLVESLTDFKIADIAGGEHHSLACTDDGKLLTWGRIDGHQVGLPNEKFTEENTIFDERNKPRILKEPTVVPDVPSVALVAAGTDHSFAITTKGKAYSWGFSANYQTGQGTDDDIEVPTLVDNSVVREKKLVFAGAGGQFSILAAAAEELATESA